VVLTFFTVVAVALTRIGVYRVISLLRCTPVNRDRHLAILLRIPAMPITHSDLMAITIPSDADHRRSEATLGCSYHAEVIGIRQSLCA
jgi:hypothetical protein